MNDTTTSKCVSVYVHVQVLPITIVSETVNTPVLFIECDACVDSSQVTFVVCMCEKEEEKKVVWLPVIKDFIIIS